MGWSEGNFRLICTGHPKLIKVKTLRQSGLASPQVMFLLRAERVRRQAGQQAPIDQDQRVTAGKGWWILGTGLREAKPTAVQSGNRQATLLGERSRRNSRDQPSVHFQLSKVGMC